MLLPAVLLSQFAQSGFEFGHKLQLMPSLGMCGAVHPLTCMS